MCIICDGATPDEALFGVHGCVETYGWFIQYVEGRTLANSWAYTIGLTLHFRHPELVLVGADMGDTGRILNGLGDMVRDGMTITPEHCFIDPYGSHTHISPVHPIHFRKGVFAVWNEYFESLGPPPPEESALEVVLPGRKPMLRGPNFKPNEPIARRPADPRRKKRNHRERRKHRP